jgi:hypothetical protein
MPFPITVQSHGAPIAASVIEEMLRTRDKPGRV